jgi:hypothetical protein
VDHKCSTKFFSDEANYAVIPMFSKFLDDGGVLTVRSGVRSTSGFPNVNRTTVPIRANISRRTTSDVYIDLRERSGYFIVNVGVSRDQTLRRTLNPLLLVICLYRPRVFRIGFDANGFRPQFLREYDGRKAMRSNSAG